jgi:hypothetical protein
MLLQKEKGKQYLYVQQAGKQGLHDRGREQAGRAELLKRTAEANQATAGNLQVVSPDVAIAEAPEKTPTTMTSNSHPTETVRVLDLSDPRESKDTWRPSTRSPVFSPTESPRADLSHQQRRLMDTSLQSSSPTGACKEEEALRL